MGYHPKYNGYLRVFLFAAGLLNVTWSVLIYLFAAPGFYDAVYERFIVALAFWIVAAASYKNRWLNHNIYPVALVLIFGFAIQAFTMVIRSNGNIYYLLANNVVIPVLTCGIFGLVELLVFGILFVIADSFIVYKLQLESWTAVYLIATNLTIFVQVATTLNQRIRADKKAKEEEDRATALKTALLRHELETAAAVQTTLLNRRIDTSDNLNIHTFFQPSTYVSGDSYSYQVLNNGKIAILWIGDVTGHGMASAILTATVYGAITAGISIRKFSADSFERDLTELMFQLNSMMIELPHDALMTMLLIGVDLESGRACCVNAGHPFPRLLSKGKVAVISARGNPLGSDHNLELQSKHFHVSREDVLLMYTDGLIECKNPLGVHMSYSDIDNCLRTACKGDAIIKIIQSRLNTLGISSKAEDDISVLVASF